LCGSSGWSNLSQSGQNFKKDSEKFLYTGSGLWSSGGTARDVAHCFNYDGLGAIVNASRSIMCAYKSEQWKNVYSEEKFYEASRAEAIRMRDDINSALRDRK